MTYDLVATRPLTHLAAIEATMYTKKCTHSLLTIFSNTACSGSWSGQWDSSLLAQVASFFRCSTATTMQPFPMPTGSLPHTALLYKERRVLMVSVWRSFIIVHAILSAPGTDVQHVVGATTSSCRENSEWHFFRCHEWASLQQTSWYCRNVCSGKT